MIPNMKEQVQKLLPKGNNIPKITTIEDFYNFYFTLTSPRNIVL